jgi:hypothetical protein
VKVDTVGPSAASLPEAAGPPAPSKKAGSGFAELVARASGAAGSDTPSRHSRRASRAGAPESPADPDGSAPGTTDAPSTAVAVVAMPAWMWLRDIVTDVQAAKAGDVPLVESVGPLDATVAAKSSPVVITPHGGATKKGDMTASCASAPDSSAVPVPDPTLQAVSVDLEGSPSLNAAPGRPTQPGPPGPDALPTADVALPTADVALPTADVALPTADVALPTADAALPTADVPTPTRIPSKTAGSAPAKLAAQSPIAFAPSLDTTAAVAATPTDAPVAKGGQSKPIQAASVKVEADVPVASRPEPVAAVVKEAPPTGDSASGSRQQATDRRFSEGEGRQAAPQSALAHAVDTAIPLATLRAEHTAQAAGGHAVEGLRSAVRSADAIGTTAPSLEARSTSAIPDDGDLRRQIVQTIRMQWLNGVGDVRVTLQPEYLGEITVSLRVEQGTVSAHVNAEVPEVRAWITAHEPLLRAGLSDQGLTLDRLVVAERTPESQPGPDERRRAPRPEPKTAPRRPQDSATFEIVV